jgi:hypothetical protein
VGDVDEDRPDEPKYLDPGEIGQHELGSALDSLYLLGDDPYTHMQAFNLSVVDEFIMALEYETLRKYMEEERTPLPEAIFLSAQSQMWIFGVYELLRTWRERAKDVIKLHENGGLQLKIESLEKDVGFKHVGREIRAEQLRRIVKDKTLIDRIKVDLRVSHMPFERIEFIRVSLGKHEVAGKKNSIAYAPGYGRINQWCGSLDYQMERGQIILGNISRRDIADELRFMGTRRYIPTDEDIASFDASMKGPPSSS